MKAATVLFFLCVISSIGFSQNLEFEKDMKTIWVAHDTASSGESEALAIAQGEKIGKKYKDAWLPYFWSAYCATQILLYPSDLKGEARKAYSLNYLNRAQKNLDRAKTLLPEDNNRVKSSTYMLQSLIYSFTARNQKDESEKYRSLQNEARNNAIKTDATNPVVMTMIATSLIREGRDETRPAKVVAGRELLQKAKQIFETFESSGVHRTLTSHFNYEWISFWLSRAEKSLNVESETKS